MEKLFKNTGNQSQGVEQKKVSNKKQILKTLYFLGSMSNSELSRIIKLSTPKINSLLVELIEDGLVRDLGRGDSSGGRRPNIYGLVEDCFYVVGITININRTIISIFNSNNQEVIEPQYLPVRMQSDFGIFSEISENLDRILVESQIEKDKVLVLGIELPGLVNQKQDINKTYFPQITNLSDEVRKVFGLPVYISHDSKLRAFTEQHFGLAKDKKNALLLQVDWGLGLGIIINGKLYAGKSGYSGEFGHLPIVDNGVLCSCGKQGCLETIVSATAIARIARHGIESGKSSLIKELVNDDIEKIDISVIIEAANRGDQFAISIFSDVGYWLGKGIVYLIQIFNPELIVLGGRVAEASQFIMAPIQQAIYTFSNRDISEDTEIKFSTLGQKAGPLGAAAYALEKLASA
ncbi:Sugar kinase of the NBD/HSP70 family, may contain an N-terminal HTH domain [Mariniphaga anaerophila]|uniref:Sugar kinase of the NBD/HSP70 family, may contain an N-terminal HTH domain n=1 Tax=Mariniphaga anaerophila TaxID=1484053 RepID=A0A1M5FQY5_9BACT|nr:ROK family transcriptional regulator [Mariniphaga anaerophila]SHF93923.1 Sugar kinase of the NBD/HSP70 family, may contain an N-terminal HTH domain [Mariniphaga anaerophila]